MKLDVAEFLENLFTSHKNNSYRGKSLIMNIESKTARESWIIAHAT